MHPKNPGADLYRQAGVDTAKGDALVDWLNSDKNSKKNPTGEPVSGIGGFAALFRPNLKGITDPLIVSSTDGVGTKVLLGLETDHLEGLGIDLVAMCVNDLYTIGARPMFFLDYYATGKLKDDDFKRILTGIKAGCHQAEMTLIGGETAELPGLYEGRHFDLAGFVVGIVDSMKQLGPHRVKANDHLYALPSSGFHSNGYSLIRKWVEESGAGKIAPDVLKNLMTPTRIYHEVPSMVDALGGATFHALANITGGGISGNLPRVFSNEFTAHISLNALPIPTWMRDFILNRAESLRAVEEVFNLGAGMIAIVDSTGRSAFEQTAKSAGIDAVAMGEMKMRKTPTEEVIFHD